MVNLKIMDLEIPEGLNIILGQSHFIKTVEDIAEAIATTVPQGKFGLAFSEASGPCLIRSDGNDTKLIKLAEKNLQKLASGHAFLIYLENCYPINVLPKIKEVEEVCHIFCATANPVKVVLAEGKQGNGILGVIDGNGPKGIESAKDKKDRKEFLRKIGYKR
jgi:uncharacterized protein